MELKPLQVWIIALLAVLLIALIYLASGVIPIDGKNRGITEQISWILPTTSGTATLTLQTTGWWSNPPTPQIMQTWVLTPTATQTKNP